MAKSGRTVRLGDRKEEVCLLFQGTVNPEFGRNVNTYSHFADSCFITGFDRTYNIGMALKGLFLR